MANLKLLNEVLFDYWFYLIDLGLEYLALETSDELLNDWR
jgi:hypothetical protein